jgi:hypothetical protein
VLKANNEVVGVAHDDHIARSLTPSPAPCRHLAITKIRKMMR